MNKRFLLHEAVKNKGSENIFRALDWEDNKRQIVFNPSRSDGLYLTLDNRFHSNSRGHYGIYYPGGSDWLLGNRQSSSDVTLGKNQLSSDWMFANEGRDLIGDKCWEIWTVRNDASQVGDLWMPSSSIARAGYDDKWEWRTYGGSIGSSNGFFRVKFEMIE